MAVSRKTFQYQTSISINRQSFLDVVVCNQNLSKKHLRVLLHLLCHLDAKMPKEISTKSIANDLGIKKDDVKDALEVLIQQDLIRESSSGSVNNGFILTF